MYHYKAFNLHFTTPFKCPELLEINENNNLEKVTIEFGETPKKLSNILNETVNIQSNNKELLLKLKTVANYYISNGNKIIIEKTAATVTEDSIRLFLFGSAIGALLFQKGYLVLHASAIKTEKGAVLFCGHSGSGKSTTLQELIKRGYKKLSDDTIALYYDEKKKKIMCIPSYPQSKLWQKSLDLLEYKNKGLRKINEDLEKYAYNTKEDFYDKKPIPIYSLFVLNTYKNNEIEVTSVEGLDKFNVIRNQTYRKKFIEKLDLKKTHLKLGTLTANQIKIKRLFRPENSNTLNDVANIIEKDIR